MPGYIAENHTRYLLWCCVLCCGAAHCLLLFVGVANTAIRSSDAVDAGNSSPWGQSHSPPFSQVAGLSFPWCSFDSVVQLCQGVGRRAINRRILWHKPVSNTLRISLPSASSHSRAVRIITRVVHGGTFATQFQVPQRVSPFRGGAYWRQRSPAGLLVPNRLVQGR